MNRRRVNIARKESEQQYQAARLMRPGAARAEPEATLGVIRGWLAGVEAANPPR